MYYYYTGFNVMTVIFKAMGISVFPPTHPHPQLTGITAVLSKDCKFRSLRITLVLVYCKPLTTLGLTL